MTVDELSAGFHQLLRRITREEAFTDVLRDAVCHNAELVDVASERVAATMVATNLIVPKVEQLEKDTLLGLRKLEEAMKTSDALLREQLDHVRVWPAA